MPEGKRIVGLLLAIGAVAAAGVGVAREWQASLAGRDGQQEIAPADQVTVYYFHTDIRCDTCLTIETQTAETVRASFAPQIASGQVRYRAVNFDAPENRHFQTDYDLAFGSVVVVGGGKWEILGEVWTLVHEDRADFDRYLVDHIRPYLRASS